MTELEAGATRVAIGVCGKRLRETERGRLDYKIANYDTILVEYEKKLQ
jgi:hypothetical protein